MPASFSSRLVVLWVERANKARDVLRNGPLDLSIITRTAAIEIADGIGGNGTPTTVSTVPGSSAGSTTPRHGVRMRWPAIAG